jgi:hypothetical protein
MGDGSTAGNVTINETACPPRPDGARGICYSLSYVAAAPYETPISHTTGVCNWAGLYLQYPTNNWGTEPGLPIVADKLSAVRFYAAVAAGTELVTFAIGGIGTRLGDAPPANACPPVEVPPGDYYDQITGSTSAMLGTQWQRVEVPISPRFPASGTATAVPIETLLGGLAWSVSATTSPLPKTIFVDDVVYE